MNILKRLSGSPIERAYAKGHFGLMSHNLLVDVANQGYIANVPKEHINSASIDVRLGKMIYREAIGRATGVADLGRKESIELELPPFNMQYILQPGEPILASTQEVFNLPNFIAAEFRLKSSVARNFLDHRFAVWVDPGFHDSALTLELYNGCRYHNLVLRPCMKIGQVILYLVPEVPESASYAKRGQYNQSGAQPVQSKGSR